MSEGGTEYVDPTTGRELRQPYRENAEYAAMVGRLIRALARRAGADVDLLPVFAAMREDLDGLMRQAVDACRADGYSWGEIAKRLGTTRQAAQQRYGPTSPEQAGQRQGEVDAVTELRTACAS